MEIKIKGGHLVQKLQNGSVYLTDDSGDRVKVDTGRYITVSSRGSFEIPVEPIDAACFTVAGAEEALLVAELAGMKIEAGKTRFTVARFYGYVGRG